jgi:hypothetical protein
LTRLDLTLPPDLAAANALAAPWAQLNQLLDAFIDNQMAAAA